MKLIRYLVQLLFIYGKAVVVSFTNLITKILDLAELQQNQKSVNIYSYDIDLLNKMATNGKSGRSEKI